MMAPRPGLAGCRFQLGRWSVAGAGDAILRGRPDHVLQLWVGVRPGPSKAFPKESFKLNRCCDALSSARPWQVACAANVGQVLACLMVTPISDPQTARGAQSQSPTPFRIRMLCIFGGECGSRRARLATIFGLRGGAEPLLRALAERGPEMPRGRGLRALVARCSSSGWPYTRNPRSGSQGRPRASSMPNF